jgi:excisionase family DNA binding protein
VGVPRIYTVREVANILQMHEETVRTLLRSNRLHGIKLGPHPTLPGRFEWRITEQALRAFLGLEDASMGMAVKPTARDDA